VSLFTWETPAELEDEAVSHEMKLRDKVALITGSGSGLGKAIALLFASEGAIVVVADIDIPAGENTVQEILDRNRQGNTKASFIYTDVSRETSVAQMVDKVVETYGGIDILVNNAGVICRKTLLDHTLVEWEKVLSVDLTGIFLCTRAVAPHMMRKKRGKIVNISSAAGQIGYTYPSYSAAKAGVINFTKSIVFDLAPKGINVNCLCPGIIGTPINQGMRNNADLMQKVIKRIPQRRIGTPEEVAKAALFLASDDSDYINGAALTIDGGLISVLSLFEE